MEPIGILQTTAADIVWREAMFIAEFGWHGDTSPLEAPALDLATGALWAVHGSPCRPRDLTELESEHAAEVLDLIEYVSGRTITELEAQHTHSSTSDVVIELSKVAWDLRRELEISIHG